MTELIHAVTQANAVLDQCGSLSFERSLKPLHGVHPLNVSGPLEEALFTLLTTWGYERSRGAKLTLTKVADWQVELLSIPLFWTGPWLGESGSSNLTVEGRSPTETPDHRTLRTLLIDSLASFFPGEAQAFKLDPTDSFGRSIEPGVGLIGPYFVLVWQAHAIVLALSWDS